MARHRLFIDLLLPLLVRDVKSLLCCAERCVLSSFAIVRAGSLIFLYKSGLVDFDVAKVNCMFSTAQCRPVTGVTALWSLSKTHLS